MLLKAIAPAPEGRLRRLRRHLYAFWAMGRPLYLMGALPLYLLGIGAAWEEGPLRPSLLGLGLLLVWLVQLMTHYNSEYWDLETDQATVRPTRISGGSRVLVQGLVAPRAARAAAAACLGLAVALALILVFFLGAGKLTLALVGVALFMGWFYSASPLRLACRGLGEMAIVVVACFLLPSTAYYLQTSSFSLSLLRLGLPLALLTFAVTLATELPDLAGDAATGKRTLVVRMGTRRALALEVASFLAGWLSFLVMAMAWGAFWGGVAFIASAPLVAWSLTSARASGQGHLVAMERMGLLHIIVLGYAAVALDLALFVG